LRSYVLLDGGNSWVAAYDAERMRVSEGVSRALWMDGEFLDVLWTS
jgi:hypothetical protein